MFKSTGQEEHGLIFSGNDLFEKPLENYSKYDPGQWEVPKIYFTEKGRPHPDLTLKKDSPAIDAGVVIPNITEKFKGKAPDLGALEYGEPLSVVGPRK